MAVISLRSYNHEIEEMIDNGQLDEAVAHCRHILTTFPKHIGTYRLLGKAHLEQQRISDATDIFQRVLSAIPDDFISNVGMSIIREDENNLDAAIWHMELAYEAQPANIAIQDELRRLYGRRDGMQPPKVRLTRGALARMYSKGGLFDQAIAELRAAIAEDPNRPDLQLLLAQLFFQTSQRVEAVEACVNILKKMPLCLEANRILAISLPDAESSDAVRNSRQIVISMDPYYAFAEPEAINSDLVSENAVNIERLEWKSGVQAGEVPSQPAWATSLGINMEKPAEENIPDWLIAAEAPAPKSANEIAPPSVSPFIWDTQEVEKIITDTSKPEETLPDWMKDAGWKPATGESTQPAEQTITPEAPSVGEPVGDELQQGDIPDWLRGIAPEDFAGTQGKQGPSEEETLSNPWLEPHQPGPTDSIIQWLEDKEPGTSVTPQTQGENVDFSPDDEVPDWLKDLDIPQATPAEAEKLVAPEVLSTSVPSAFLEEPPAPETPGIEAATVEKVVEPVSQAPATQPEIPSAPLIAESEQPSASAEDEIPDWLRDIAVAATAAEIVSSAVEKPTEEPPLVAEPEQVEQPLAAETPTVAELEQVEQPLAAEAPMIAEPEQVEQPLAAETPTVAEPEQVEQPLAAETPMIAEPEQVEQPLAAETPMIAEHEIPPQPTAIEEAPIEVIMPAAEEVPAQEQAPAEEAPSESKLPLAAAAFWAAEKLTKPEEAPVGEEPSAAVTEPEPEMPVTSEVPPVMVAPIAAGIVAAETPSQAEELPATEPPPQPSEQPQVDQLIPVEAEIPPLEPDSMNEAAAFAWLEGLAAEQDAIEEGLTTPPIEGEVQPPEWVKLEMELSTEEPISTEPPAVAEEPAVPAEEVPDWIKGLGEEPEAEPAPEAPLPAFVSEAEATPVSPAPAEAEEEKLEELPAWLLEMEQPEGEKEAPAQYDESLEWKVEELPDWLKEITESEETVEVAPPEQPVSAAEVAAAAVIAGLARPEETAPPSEAVEQPAELAQPEVPIAPAVAEFTMPEETAPPSEAVEQPGGIPQPEIAAAAIIAGLSKPEEAAPPPEAVEQAVEVPQPEVPAPIQAEAAPIPAVEEITYPVVESAPAEPMEPTQVEAVMQPDPAEAVLTDARNALTQGQPSQAVDLYAGLIKQNYHLDEIIKDLQEAVYRFPVDVDIWVTLGDAHSHTHALQDALNAYTKAEELAR